MTSDSSSAFVVEARKLSKERVSSFLRKRVRVLDELTLSIASGETYGLLGPNGAGKTTTLKLLLGLLKPDGGTVIVLGKPAGHPEALARVGFLPENPYFYSYLTGVEFLDFVARLFGIAASERKEKLATLLKLVGIESAKDTPMRKYSKGMLQRLGIAQSLLNDPEVVFWDEPMSGLDPIGRRDVRAILLNLKEKGKTVFLNSHLLPDVNDVCDRVGILHKGKLVCEETIANISKGGGYNDLEDYFLSAVGMAEKSAQETKSGFSAEAQRSKPGESDA